MADFEVALDKPVVRPAYFVEFFFRDSTFRVTTWNQTINWGGYDWLGVGQLGNISEVSESESLEARALDFTLNVSQEAFKSIALNSAEQFRGRRVRMYMCPMSDSYTLTDTPRLCWTGKMHSMPLSVSKDSGHVTIRCENSIMALKRIIPLRINAQQHKRIYPTDTGFDRLISLLADQQLWLSKRFQQK